MKMINVKGEGFIIDETGHTSSYLSDHEISEADLLASLACAIRKQESLKTVEANLRRILGIK